MDITDAELARIVATGQALNHHADQLHHLTTRTRARAAAYQAAAAIAGSPAGHHWTASRGLERPAAPSRVAITCIQVARQLLDHADRDALAPATPTQIDRALQAGRTLLAAGRPTPDTAPHEGACWFTAPPTNAAGLTPCAVVWRRIAPSTHAIALIADTTADQPSVEQLPDYVIDRLVTIGPGQAPAAGLDGWLAQLIRGLAAASAADPDVDVPTLHAAG